MAVAFMFPGQGSQSVGMGKLLYDNFACAREVFEEVDDSLNQKLSNLMFNGDIEELTLTYNAQPAIMAVSIAVMRVLESQGLDLSKNVNLMAGHSLGEYSALCTAKVFSISDTAKLLKLRGKAMQKAVPEGEGAMAAVIGCSIEDIEEVCASVKDGVCEIANDNGGGQIVISGAKIAVERAAKILKEKSAKRVVFLPVSAPFHCSLMAPAAEVMQQAFAAVEFKKPIVPVVSNVNLAKEIDSTKISDLLVQQIVKRVRWRETIELFAQIPDIKLYEIGWGKVLSGIAKRIVSDVESQTVYELNEIDKCLAEM